MLAENEKEFRPIIIVSDSEPFTPEDINTSIGECQAEIARILEEAKDPDSYWNEHHIDEDGEVWSPPLVPTLDFFERKLQRLEERYSLMGEVDEIVVAQKF